MKFWRVCHKENKHSFSETYIGPYGCSKIGISLCWAHEADRDHPSPPDETPNVQDFWGMNMGYAVCGNDSPEALYLWFLGHWGKLRADHVVRVYTVEDENMAVSDRTGQAVAILGDKEADLEMAVQEFLDMVG